MSSREPMPPPPDLGGVEWRAAGIEDAAAIAGLLDVCFEADGGYRVTPVEVQNELSMPGLDPALDVVVATDAASAVIAMNWCQLPQGAATKWRVFPWPRVHPQHRGRGIGTYLLEWVTARGRRRLGDVDDELPKVIQQSVYDWREDERAFLEEHGFRIVRYFSEMRRDLSEPIVATALAPRLRIEQWSKSRTADARAVHNAAFADHWGSQPIPQDRWDAHHDEFFLPEASFMVYDGDEPIAYLSSSKYPHDFEDRGRTESWIEGIGTVQSHRKHGVASHLITLAMSRFREDGMGYACLGVDSANPTGANALYEGLGFVVEKGSIMYEKPLFD